MSLCGTEKILTVESFSLYYVLVVSNPRTVSEETVLLSLQSVK